MFGSYRVVAVTPAGRKRYMEILFSYVLKHRPMIDQYQIWVNTDNRDDLEYLESLRNCYTDFVTLLNVDPSLRAAFSTCITQFRMEGSFTAQCGLIGSFFRHCVDKNTIYIRLDDDICYVEPNALRALVSFRIDNPLHFVVYANTINNPICSYIHQQLGHFNADVGIITSDPFCEMGWANGLMAKTIHDSFLSRIQQGTIHDLSFDRWIIHDYTRVAINCISWFGRDFAEHFDNRGPLDEEVFLSMTVPAQLRRPNCICGKAIVAHFAYRHQRAYLEDSTSLLQQYRTVAGIAEAASGASSVARHTDHLLPSYSVETRDN